MNEHCFSWTDVCAVIRQMSSAISAVTCVCVLYFIYVSICKSVCAFIYYLCVRINTILKWYLYTGCTFVCEGRQQRRTEPYGWHLLGPLSQYYHFPCNTVKCTYTHSYTHYRCVQPVSICFFILKDFSCYHFDQYWFLIWPKDTKVK